MAGDMVATSVAGGVLLVCVALILRSAGGSGAAASARASENGSKEANGHASNEDKYPAGPLHIFFGSQTGTAEGFARVLMEEGRRCGFDARSEDLEDFQPEAMVELDRAIFLIATHGEGEPTDNAIEFFKWAEGLEQPWNVKFMVFGLGNRQYEFFNAAAKKLQRLLERSGGEPLMEIGLGDDDDQLEEDFENWKEQAWPVLKERFHPAGVASQADDGSPPELDYTVKYIASGGDKPRRFRAEEVTPASRHFFGIDSYKVTVAANAELRSAEDSGSTKHMEVDLSGSGLRYETADNAYVMPLNAPALVACAAGALGYDLDSVFLVEGKSSGFKHFLPTPCSVRTALTRYCDLTGLPRRSTLHALAAFATDDAERARLLHLSSKEGAEDYHAFVEGEGRGLVELLSAHFTSLDIPLDHFLYLCPRLAPRAYTISSSAAVNRSLLSMTVSVVGQQYADGRSFTGVCTGYLAGLAPGSELQMYVKASTFRLPRRDATPVIMIGPGTGVAPMRAMCMEREAMRRGGRTLGEAVLYFGCKRRELDYLYREQMEGWLEDGIVDDLRLAFSREGPQKVYVQHLLREDSRKVWNLIGKRGAHVYVCGATNMGADVLRVLKEIVQQQGKLDGDAFMHKMQSDGRYVAELWSA